jgi:hypothetical protein
MTYSYLMVPLKDDIHNFSLLTDDNINMSLFDLDKIFPIFKESYPGIIFNNEGNGNYFANYPCSRGNVEVWVYCKKHCISVYDSLDNILDIGKRLRMSVFDVEGDQKIVQ